MLATGAGAGILVSASAAYAPILRGIPAKAEAANLAVFLSSPHARVAPAVREWRRILGVCAVLAVGAAVVGYAYAHLTAIDFDVAALGARLGKYAAISAAAFVVGQLYTKLPVPKAPPRWVSAGERGVRFGWRRPIAWTDVAAVTFEGPDPDDPDDKGATVWKLRNGSVVRLPLQASRRTPEDLVLTARSHMEALA
jgi:hypothetical protein